MRIPCPARRAALPALVAVLLTAGCGLFQSEPSPPGLREVAVARQRDAAEWGMLEEVWMAHQRDPAEALDLARSLQAQEPESVRLAVLAQDLAVELGDPAIQREFARRRLEETDTPLDRYLLARLTVDREERRVLLEQVVAEDPELLQAQLSLLSLRARAGRPEVLETLIRLLRRDPGLAEGWRLLGELAAQYARADLVRTAARTEPWSRFEDPARAVLARADAALRAGDPASALEELKALPADHRAGSLARAAALADLGRPRVAADLLLVMLLRDPGDPVALFNLGLLERDYFFRPAEAGRRFRAFLEADAARGGGDLRRRAQAELWVAEADAQVRAQAEAASRGAAGGGGR